MILLPLGLVVEYCAGLSIPEVAAKVTIATSNILFIGELNA
jgi:hypothetical protein